MQKRGCGEEGQQGEGETRGSSGQDQQLQRLLLRVTELVTRHHHCTQGQGLDLQQAVPPPRWRKLMAACLFLPLPASVLVPLPLPSATWECLPAILGEPGPRQPRVRAGTGAGAQRGGWPQHCWTGTGAGPGGRGRAGCLLLHVLPQRQLFLEPQHWSHASDGWGRA